MAKDHRRFYQAGFKQPDRPGKAQPGAQAGEMLLQVPGRTTHAPPAQAAYRDPAGYIGQVEYADACDPEWRAPGYHCGNAGFRRAIGINAGATIPSRKGWGCYGPQAVIS